MLSAPGHAVEIDRAINVLDHRGKNLSYDVNHTKIDDEHLLRPVEPNL